MKFLEYGAEQNDTILMLHGGGLAPWNYTEIANLLQDKFHVILPILDGHSGSDQDFTSIKQNADEIISHIDEHFHGNVFMLCGLSLGGQILTEILARRCDICRYAVIESALVLPMKMTYFCIQPIFSLCYPLIQLRWFARMQFQSLHIQDKLFEDYYRDSKAITKENMVSFLKANSDYTPKAGLEASRAQTLVLVGGRESGIMKRSAALLHKQIPYSTLEILPGYSHGELSLNHPDEYVRRIEILLSK